MSDQAEKLRTALEKADASHTKTIAVMSGKGGVGKSNFSLNFSIALCKSGYKVLIIDMDIGMGNIDILMGSTAKYTIADYFEGKIPLESCLVSGPAGLHYIAGGTGLSHIVKLDEDSIWRFLGEFDRLASKYDYVFFDMGAGLSEYSAKFILSVEDIFVVTTPEPPSITDAYAAMKHVHVMDSSIPFHLIINKVQSGKEGTETFSRISSALQKFLKREVNYIGSIPEDKTIQRAVKSQVPLLIYNEKAPAAKAISIMAGSYLDQKHPSRQKAKSHGFVSKLKGFLFER